MVVGRQVAGQEAEEVLVGTGEGIGTTLPTAKDYMVVIGKVEVVGGAAVVNSDGEVAHPNGNSNLEPHQEPPPHPTRADPCLMV